MNFVVEQSFKSNKANTFTPITAASEEEAKGRAMDMLNSSIDVRAVDVYILTASASKVEIATWN